VFNIVSEGPPLRQVIATLSEKKIRKGEKPLASLSPAQWIAKLDTTITAEHSSLYLCVMWREKRREEREERREERREGRRGERREKRREKRGEKRER
jgi:hypothetical protein